MRVRRAAALWRTAPGYLAVAAVDGRSVQMGGPAAAIWRSLPGPDEEPIAVSAVVAQLATEYEVSPTTVERDAMRVLDALEAMGCAVRLS
jgi:hypothetical protein